MKINIDKTGHDNKEDIISGQCQGKPPNIKTCVRKYISWPHVHMLTEKFKHVIINPTVIYQLSQIMKNPAINMETKRQIIHFVFVPTL